MSKPKSSTNINKPAKDSELQRLNILLVEDTKCDVILISTLLTDMGHNVWIAKDGSEALQIVADNNFDIIFVDITLPILSGLDVAKQIRSKPNRFQIPIVAVTNDTTPGNRTKFMAAGLNGYIAKPVSKMSLEIALLRATGRRKNLLVIEDDKAFFEATKLQLTQKTGSNYGTIYPVACNSVAEAIKLLDEQDFDIALLDYTLPDSYGLSGLKQLRELYPCLPVILCTGAEDEAVALDALKLGAQDCVIKGDPNSNLLRIVRYALERNEIEIHLKLAQTLALAASHAKGDFLANMSHEIRTPLTAILGFNEIALEEAMTPTQSNALRAVKRNCEHLIQVINNVLDLSKIENNSLEISKTSVSPISVLNEIEFALKSRALDKGISYTCDYIFPIPSKISTDPLYLKQILFNLIGNAIKFTNSGSVKILVSFSVSQNQIIFKVIDSGIGITSECAAKLFLPFSQGDTSTTRRYGGTGLGLVISQRLANAMQGSVTFDSVVGVGSTFTLSIDAGPEAILNLIYEFPEMPEPEEKSENLDIKLGGRVLIVDDMPDNRALMSYYVDQIGAVVTLAEDGAEAIELMKEEEFDLVLLDMQMPVVDGYECASRLRKMGVTIPIVAITASAMSGAEDQCLHAGCTSYLRKPFTKEQMSAVLKEYLSEPQKHLTSLPDKKLGHFANTIEPGLLPVALNFVRQFPERMKKLLESYNSNNMKELKFYAHQLAGAKMFGFSEIGKAAYNLEEMIVTEKLSEIDELVSDIKRLAELVIGSEDEIVTLIRQKKGPDFPAGSRINARALPLRDRMLN